MVIYLDSTCCVYMPAMDDITIMHAWLKLDIATGAKWYLCSQHPFADTMT